VTAALCQLARKLEENGTSVDYARLPERRSQDYAEFVFTLPEPMARCRHQQARSLLAHARIGEPVTWEPPFGWVTGIPWPGPDPDGITPGDLHPLIRANLPVRAIAARLGTTADHVRLTVARTRHHGERFARDVTPALKMLA
jgi:hypothetical protein